MNRSNPLPIVLALGGDRADRAQPHRPASSAACPARGAASPAAPAWSMATRWSSTAPASACSASTPPRARRPASATAPPMPAARRPSATWRSSSAASRSPAGPRTATATAATSPSAPSAPRTSTPPWCAPAGRWPTGNTRPPMCRWRRRPGSRRAGIWAGHFEPPVDLAPRAARRIGGLARQGRWTSRRHGPRSPASATMPRRPPPCRSRRCCMRHGRASTRPCWPAATSCWPPWHRLEAAHGGGHRR